MKVVFVASFLNNHLLPFCLELENRTDFCFISTENWIDNSFNRGAIKKDFVLNYFDETERLECIRKVEEADIAIFGGSRSELLRVRKQLNKISFVYTERFFKRGTWRRFIPSTAKKLRESFLKNNENLYILCSGSFVANDLKLIGFDTRRCFRFGYFPLADQSDIQALLDKKNNDVPKLLYVGRLLKLKRVKDVLKCCRMLKAENVPFELNIVGDGPEKNYLQRICKKYALDTVYFLGAKKPEEVLEIMAQSNVLYFSSNRLEGWGAVVNEAMSNACPVIASNACGSTAYLIKDGVNGYAYKSGNVKDMFAKTKLFLHNENPNIYVQAYNTVKNEWNATVAAQRFIEICMDLIENKPLTVYERGPMSKEI